MTQAQIRELEALDHAFTSVGLDKQGHSRRNYLRKVQRDEVTHLADQLKHSRLTRNTTLLSS